MKSALSLLSLATPLLIYVGCSLDESTEPGPGTGGTQTAGGSPSAGGMGTATGGVGTPTAGTGSPTAGAATTGGSPAGGSGGQSGAANMAGKAGSAGSPATGGSSFGGSVGSGGASGGDTSKGGTSSAGMGGGVAGMAGAKSDVPTPATLAPGLDGHLIVTPCGDQPNTDDCASSGWKSTAVDNFANHPCRDAKLEANITFPVAGTPGTTYDVTMHFYGVMEPRQYANVMREATGDPNLNGGTPTPWAEANAGANINNAGDQNYNTYEIHVYNNNTPKQEVRGYFLNADNGTGHYTMLINYEKTIKVIGGGEVRLRVFDNNCRMIKNCGASGGTPCADKARSVDVSAASPAPTMAQLTQPGLGLAPDHSGQWWLIDVTKVAVAP